jgi:hypothetical protein
MWLKVLSHLYAAVTGKVDTDPVQGTDLVQTKVVWQKGTGKLVWRK